MKEKGNYCSVYLVSLGFLGIYIIPILPILCARVGQAIAYPNLFAFIPLFFAYVFVPLLQSLFPYQIPSISPQISSSRWGARYYRILPLFCLFPQLLMLYIGVAYWSSDILNIWGKVGYLLSIGAYSSFIAINVAHELIHRSYRCDRFLGGVLLSTVYFGIFKSSHIGIHHRYVGTPLDFATAKRGQSIYEFWYRNFIGHFYTAFRHEFTYFAKLKRSFWQSDLLFFYLLSCVWLSLAIWGWGWQGGLFFILQSAIAIAQLDWINYLQHYGLERKQNTSDQYEPVQYYHSWSQGLFIHDLLLLNLFRHSDHHVNPKCSYQSLRHFHDCPQYPYQHDIMMALSLVPPLFNSIVHPCLDRWEKLRKQEEM